MRKYQPVKKNIPCNFNNEIHSCLVSCVKLDSLISFMNRFTYVYNNNTLALRKWKCVHLQKQLVQEWMFHTCILWCILQNFCWMYLVSATWNLHNFYFEYFIQVINVTSFLRCWGSITNLKYFLDKRFCFGSNIFRDITWPEILNSHY